MRHRAELDAMLVDHVADVGLTLVVRHGRLDAVAAAVGVEPVTPRSTQGSSLARWLASGVFLAAILPGCAGSDAATTAPVSESVRPEASPSGLVVEDRNEIGPRALDVDAAVMMVVDSIDVAGDDIFVRVRVVNGSDQFLNVEAEDNLYGPLLELRDSRDNTYPARAVEPAGVASYVVGEMRFRVDGPFDPDAEEFAVEIATGRGRLATDPIPVPGGDVVRWLTETPLVLFSDLVVTEQDSRSIQVLDIADRGTHVEVSIRASDTSGGFSIPDEVSATLTLPDGTELESLPFDRSATVQSNEFTGVLRFLGGLPTEPGTLSLNMAGLDIEIPLDRTDTAQPAQSPTTLEPLFAVPPRLPDLLHFDVHPAPLPSSTIKIL